MNVQEHKKRGLDRMEGMLKNPLHPLPTSSRFMTVSKACSLCTPSALRPTQCIRHLFTGRCLSCGVLLLCSCHAFAHGVHHPYFCFAGLCLPLLHQARLLCQHGPGPPGEDSAARRHQYHTNTVPFEGDFGVGGATADRRPLCEAPCGPHEGIYYEGQEV